MTAVERLLRTAGGEVGVTERPAGSNRVKYNTWFYGKEVSGASYPWCCVFVCWVFHHAGLGNLLRRTGGCTTMMNWFKAKGRLAPVREARPGDLVFYQFNQDAYADHIGIVERVDRTGVVAIEGNTSATSDDNGGAVMRRTRRWNVIMAVARPDYESAERKDEADMTKEEIRSLVTHELEQAAQAERKGRYQRLEEVPAWARGDIERLMELGALKGNGRGELDLSVDMTRVLTAVARLTARGEGTGDGT